MVFILAIRQIAVAIEIFLPGKSGRPVDRRTDCDQSGRFQQREAISFSRREQPRYIPGIGIDLAKYNRKAVSDQQIGAVRSELGVKSGEILILMIAEFNPGKRHADLLNAIQQINRGDIHFAFAGVGPLLNQLRRGRRACPTVKTYTSWVIETICQQ